MIPNNDHDLKVAAMAIITYMSIAQTGAAPEIGEDGVIEAAAFLEDEILEQTLEIISQSDIDKTEMFEAEDDEDDA